MPVGKRGGRVKGQVNKTTRDVRELAQSFLANPKYRANLRARLEDGTVPPAVEAMLWHYAYGKPAERLEHSGPDAGAIVVRWGGTPPEGEA